MKFVVVLFLFAFLIGFIIYASVLYKNISKFENEHFDWALEDIVKIDLDIASDPNASSEVLNGLSENKEYRCSKSCCL